jgi:hypothetical protein
MIALSLLRRLKRNLFIKLTDQHQLASQTTEGSVFVHRVAYKGWKISRPYNAVP